MSICHRGFTLVEIMVVMLIISAGISLVGPRMFHAYQTIRASAEERKMIEILEAFKIRSFLRQVSCAVTLEDNVLRTGDEKLRIDFDYIAFPPRVITFNENGFPDTRIIPYLIRGEEKNLILRKEGIGS